MTHLPTIQAARETLAAVDPAQYARTRNALDGAVTRLSPYITHNLLDIPRCVQTLRSQYRLSFDDKLIFEFAWREFFHHAWRHLGRKILSDIRAPVWPGVHAQELPADIRQARTGVPAIDQSIRALYATGYLHNHARMWLASYVVHLRKVHWRAGADWMYGYLLDGDLASNHLSWQWVAATFSSKPYLFNAENVVKYAPHAYASEGTAIDTTYDALDDIARSRPDVGCEPGNHPAVAVPDLQALPPGVASASIKAIQQAANSKQVRLVHPWLLSEPSRTGLVSIGIIHAPFHAEFPWSAQRWAWVIARMQALCPLVFIGDASQLTAALANTSVVASTATLNFHYDAVLPQLAQELSPPPRLLPDPDQLHSSFTKFYETARHMAKSLDALTPLNSVGIEALTRRRHQ